MAHRGFNGVLGVAGWPGQGSGVEQPQTTAQSSTPTDTVWRSELYCRGACSVAHPRPGEANGDER